MCLFDVKFVFVVYRTIKSTGHLRWAARSHELNRYQLFSPKHAAHSSQVSSVHGFISSGVRPFVNI